MEHQAITEKDPKNISMLREFVKRGEMTEAAFNKYVQNDANIDGIVDVNTSTTLSSTGDKIQFNGFTPNTLSFETIRRRLAAFANDRDWNQFHTPRNLLLAMVGEVGELSELFQWRGDDGCKPGLRNWSKDERVHLGEELSDVLLYLLRLSDRCEIDLGKAVLDKLEKNKTKYPASKVRGSSRKYSEYNDNTK